MGVRPDLSHRLTSYILVLDHLILLLKLVEPAEETLNKGNK